MEAGNLLAYSLDYEETLRGVATLAVRGLADFCVIDVVEDGEVRRLQVAHADASLGELTEELLRFPLDRTRPHLSLEALESGRSALVPEVSDALLESLTQGPEHRRILRALNPRSLMAIPLLARGVTLGVVLFVSSSSTYDEDDVALAEKLVQIAGLEVDNARLYREAQRAIQARDRVLGIVAHDLRNPLNAIVMSAELLLDHPLAGKGREEHARVILRSSRRMERLIRDLLDVARIEADRLLVQREVLAPARLIEEAVQLNAALAASKSLSLLGDPPADAGWVMGDRDRILQVLSNLIENGIKFTPEGGRIRIWTDVQPDAVRFSVADDGPGISPDELPHLFESFWQARTGSIDGAGLGLMISRGIVEAHGGSIWVESTPGQGSTFHFTLPAAPVPLHATAV